MNIYEKINVVKLGLANANLKKSGKNKFANFEYFELADITPKIIELCQTNKLFTKISFGEMAILTIIDVEKPTDMIEYQSPIANLELKGCNAVQALGGAQTYLRRYLYLIAFDIVEPDLLDSYVGKNKIEQGQEFVKEMDDDSHTCPTCGNKMVLGKDGKTYYCVDCWKKNKGL
jgi:hypothetical protein